MADHTMHNDTEYHAIQARASDIATKARELRRDPIKVGVLVSLTGQTATNERGVAKAALLAIDQINQEEVITGKCLIPVLRDGQSNSTTFVEHARNLIDTEAVPVIVGTWTSAARKAVLAEIDRSYGASKALRDQVLSVIEQMKQSTSDTDALTALESIRRTIDTQERKVGDADTVLKELGDLLHRGIQVGALYRSLNSMRVFPTDDKRVGSQSDDKRYIRDCLLIYPVQYEGLEKSEFALYTGAVPNQQTYPAMKWQSRLRRSQKQTGEIRDDELRAIIIGSDYIYPRSAAVLCARRFVKHSRSTPLGIYFVKSVRGNDRKTFSESDKEREKTFTAAATHVGTTVTISDFVHRVLPAFDEEHKPNLILNFINGDDNKQLFESLKTSNAKWIRELPTISFSMTEDEVASFTGNRVDEWFPESSNDFLATTYKHSLTREESPGTTSPNGSLEDRTFAELFRHFWQNSQIHQTSIEIQANKREFMTTDAMWNTYLGVHLWAAAVNHLSGTPRRSEVTKVLGDMGSPGVSFSRYFMPDNGGDSFGNRFNLSNQTFCTFNPEWRHMSHRTYILKINQDLTTSVQPIDFDDDFAKEMRTHRHPEPFPDTNHESWRDYTKALWFASDVLPTLDYVHSAEMRELLLHSTQPPRETENWFDAHDANSELFAKMYGTFEDTPRGLYHNVQTLVAQNPAYSTGERDLQQWFYGMNCNDWDVRAIQAREAKEGVLWAKAKAFYGRLKKHLYLFDFLHFALRNCTHGVKLCIDRSPTILTVKDFDKLAPIIHEDASWRLNKGNVDSNKRLRLIRNAFEALKKCICDKNNYIQCYDPDRSVEDSICHHVAYNSGEGTVDYQMIFNGKRESGDFRIADLLDENPVGSASKLTGNTTRLLIAMRTLFGDLKPCLGDGNGPSKARYSVHNIKYSDEGIREIVENDAPRDNRASKLDIVHWHDGEYSNCRFIGSIRFKDVIHGADANEEE